jgi:hypothetical protein
MHTAVTYWTVASETIEWITFLVLADIVAALVVFSAASKILLLKLALLM